MRFRHPGEGRDLRTRMHLCLHLAGIPALAGMTKRVGIAWRPPVTTCHETPAVAGAGV